MAEEACPNCQRLLKEQQELLEIILDHVQQFDAAIERGQFRFSVKFARECLRRYGLVR